jgi:hypothetical protein
MVTGAQSGYIVHGIRLLSPSSIGLQLTIAPAICDSKMLGSPLSSNSPRNDSGCFELMMMQRLSTTDRRESLVVKAQSGSEKFYNSCRIEPEQ